MDNLTKSALWATLAAIIAIVWFLITILNKNKRKKEETMEEPGEERIVKGQNLIVYNKSHTSTGILRELEIGTEYIIYLNTDYAGFYKVKLKNGLIGYVNNNK